MSEMSLFLLDKRQLTFYSVAMIKSFRRWGGS